MLHTFHTTNHLPADLPQTEYIFLEWTSKRHLNISTSARFQVRILSSRLPCLCLAVLVSR